MASNTTSGWANTNLATVKPRLDTSTENGGVIWGQEYEIKCTWRMPEQIVMQSDSQGRERVPKWTVWTEDARPKEFDMIRLNSTEPDFKEILTGRGEDDMSFFGEPPTFTLQV